MIPNFKEYVLIYESVVSGLMGGISVNKRGYTHDVIKDKFIEMNYEYLGELEIYEDIYGKANVCDEIINSVPQDIIDILMKYYDIDNYLQENPELYSTTSFSFKDGDEERFREILSEPYIDKIKACYKKIKYGNDRLYFVLWNDEHKYFYFLYLPEGYGHRNHGLYGFVELWLRIRTFGIDTVIKEVEEIKIKGEDRDIKREEEKELRYKQRFPKEWEYKQRVKKLKEDIEENPDNYEEIDKNDLPKDILDVIKSNEYMDSPYIVYKKHISTDPYDMETVMCYVNDDNFTKGYKFQQIISRRKSGTYWGD